MSSVVEAVERRHTLALRNLRAATALVGNDRVASASEQLRVETAFDDFARYSQMRSMLGDAAIASSPYLSGRRSFWADVAQSKMDRAASARLEEHRQAVADLELRAGGTTADHVGLVPPRYLVDLAAPTAATTAPFVAATQRPLPERGAAVVLSRATASTQGREQSAENAPLTADDPATEPLTIELRTFYSEAVVSFGAAERGAIAGMVDTELSNALSTITEAEALDAVLSTTGVGTLTADDASPTAAELLRSIAQAVAQSAAARKQAPDLIVMHPRRWTWLCSRTEAASIGQPIGLPRPGAGPEVVGRLFGSLDVIATPAMPTNAGTGENQDRMAITRRDDVIVMLAPPTGELVRDYDGGADVLSAKVRLLQFAALGGVAFYPSSTVVIDGTALVTPTW